MGLYADMSIYVMIGSVIIFNYLEVPELQSIERKLVSAGGMPSIDLIRGLSRSGPVPVSTYVCALIWSVELE